MPFDVPPFPTTFDVGTPGGGHMHFANDGTQTLYGPDGVTVLFQLSPAAGMTVNKGSIVGLDFKTSNNAVNVDITSVGGDRIVFNDSVSTTAGDIEAGTGILAMRSPTNMGIGRPEIDMTDNAVTVHAPGTGLLVTNDTHIQGTSKADTDYLLGTASMPRGKQVFLSPGSIATGLTGETIGTSQAVTVVSGRRYSVKFHSASVNTNVANSVCQLRLRVGQNGVSTASTLIDSTQLQIQGTTQATGNGMDLEGDWVATFSGTAVFGLSVQTASGTGVFQLGVTQARNWLRVDDNTAA